MKIADTQGVTRSNIYNVPPDLIQTAENSRRYLHSDSSIAELAADMAERGQLVPVRIRRNKDESLILIDGERRLKAALYINQMGLTQDKFKLACILAEADDLASFEQSLVSNLKRRDLSPIDMAHAISRLEALGRSRKDICRIMGKSATSVSESLSLLKLPQKVQRLIHEGKMAPATGMEIARLPEEQIAPAVEMILNPGSDAGTVGLVYEDETPAMAAGKTPRGKAPRRKKVVTQVEVKRIREAGGGKRRRKAAANRPRSLKEIRNFFLALESGSGSASGAIIEEIEEFASSFLQFMDGKISESVLLDSIRAMAGPPVEVPKEGG